MRRIEREFHFHAAHRNTELENDPCSSIHGHTYHCTVVIDNPKIPGSSVGILFSEIKARCELLFNLLDHSFIIYDQDPLFEVLIPFGMRMYPMKDETSAENLAQHIFTVLTKNGLPVIEVRLQETTTSLIVYNNE